MKKFIAIICLTLLLTSCSSLPDVDYRITKNSTIEDFKGKPSVILFGAKWCPHCREEVPVFKEKLWDVYKDQVNLWVNTVWEKFDVSEIAQGVNKNLDFSLLTGNECWYIPSFVVLDERAVVVMESCGKSKEIDDAVRKIKAMVD